MARNKSKRKSNRNNAPTKANHRKVDRLFSRIPVTRRLRSSDPPVLPTHIDMAIKVRYPVVYAGDAATSPTSYAVITPSSAGSLGAVNVYYEEGATGVRGSATIRNLAIDADELFDAAAMRLFGTLMSSAVGAAPALRLVTEFAIQSVSLYGPIEPHESDSVRLQVDFGDGMPGAVIQDSSNRLNRAAVSASTSQMVWRRYGVTSATDGSVVATLSIPVGASGSAVDPVRNINMGILDATVHVRRAFIEVVTLGDKGGTIEDSYSKMMA